MTPDLKALGSKIKAKRVGRRLSIEDAAALFKLPIRTYREIEGGDFQGDHRLVRQIADEMGVRYRPSESPYVGLRSFRSDDARFFFGRSKLVAELLEPLRAKRKMILLGPSGSGKSSLLEAGIGAKWEGPVAVCRPSPDPIYNLASAIFSLWSDGAREPSLANTKLLRETLEKESAIRGVGVVLDLLKRVRDPLLIIDQFEELWSSENQEVRPRYTEFLKHLLKTVHEDSRELHVLVGCRSDALGIFGDGQELIRQFSIRPTSVSLAMIEPMDEAELTQAITDPARTCGGRIGPDLVAHLTAFARDNPSALPIIQFTLHELWNKVGTDLTKADLDALGDIQALLTGHIESRLEEFVEKDALRAVTTALVDPATYGLDQPKRRKAPCREFVGDVEDDIIRSLVDARIVSLDFDGSSGESYLDVTHEVILWSWSRLRAWCRDLEPFADLVTEIRARFTSWCLGERAPKHLLDDHLVLRLRASGDVPSLGTAVDAYIETSREFYRRRTRDHWRGRFEAAINGQGEELVRVITTSREALASPELVGLLDSILEDHSDERVRLRARLIKRLEIGGNVTELFEVLRPIDVLWLNSITDYLDYCLEGRGLDEEPDPVGTESGDWLKMAVLRPTAPWLRHELVAIDFIHRESKFSTIERLQLLDRIRASWWTLVTVWLDGTRDDASEARGWLEHLAAHDVEILARLIGRVFPAGDLVRLIRSVGWDVRSTLAGALADSQDVPDLDSGARIQVVASRAYAALRVHSADTVFATLRDRSDKQTLATLIGYVSEHGVPKELDWRRILLPARTADERALAVAVIGTGGYAAPFGELVEALKASELSVELVSTLEWYAVRTGQERDFRDWLDTEAVGDELGDSCRSIEIGGHRFKLVKVPRGEVVVGPQSAADQRIYLDSEHVFHTGVSHDFYVFDRLITVGAFQSFIEAAQRQDHIKISHVSPRSDCPVVAVTWTEAREFCSWIDGFLAEGRFGVELRGFRCVLPTEAMWEHMCRAGESSAFHFGDDANLLKEFGWYSANSEAITRPGAGKLPNPFGIFDLHGNCWEWCRDYYGTYPRGWVGWNYPGPEDGETRVLRGGCWNLDSIWCRSATRNAHSPQNRNYYLSFRPCLVGADR